MTLSLFGFGHGFGVVGGVRHGCGRWRRANDNGDDDDADSFFLFFLSWDRPVR
jgi:hypothetical protein